jgi:hypothetical protein
LLAKCGFDLVETGYIYSLEYGHKESIKKKVLNILYKLLSLSTTKYLETLVVVAKPAR